MIREIVFQISLFTVMANDSRWPTSSLSECSICKEMNSDPIILPCTHMSRLKCMKCFFKDKLSDDLVSCRICRKKFSFHNFGVDDSPKNFFIEPGNDLSEPMRRQYERCSDKVTDLPLRTQAVMYCVECQRGFCEECLEFNRKSKDGLEREFTDSGDDNTRAAVKKMKNFFCIDHPTRADEMYCLDCKEAVCTVCAAERHKSHVCSDVNEVVVQFRQQMTNDIKNMTETIKKYHDALEELEVLKDYFNSAVKSCEKNIYKRAEQLKKMIDSEKQKLLQDMSSRKTDKIRQIELLITEIKHNASFIESLAEYTEELRDQGEAFDVAQEASIIHDKANELVKTDVSRAVSDLGAVRVSFKAIKLSTKAARYFVGHIDWQHVKGITTSVYVAVKYFASRALSHIRLPMSTFLLISRNSLSNQLPVPES